MDPRRVVVETGQGFCGIPEFQYSIDQSQLDLFCHEVMYELVILTNQTCPCQSQVQFLTWHKTLGQSHAQTLVFSTVDVLIHHRSCVRWAFRLEAMDTWIPTWDKFTGQFI